MFIQKHLNLWLNKRIPAANEFQLNHRSIFIFPAKFGILFIALCCLLFLLGTNYQNNLMLILCYFLLALLLVNLFASYTNFSSLNVKLGRIPEVFAGDEVHLPLRFNGENLQKSNMHGIVNISLMGQKVSQWFDCDKLLDTVILNYQNQDRGLHQLPRLTFSNYFPLGLYKCWTHLAFSRRILVFPKPIPCEIALSQMNNSSDTSKQQTTMHLEAVNQDDYSHLKVYQLGDSLHHVAWKQLAKGRGMYSKQFEGVTPQYSWLVMPSCNSQQIENTLSKLCFQVLELSRQGVRFGLNLGDVQLAPNSGEAHRIQCLNALALFSNANAK